MDLPSPEGWRRIEPILDRALDLPPRRRRVFLDAACGEDRELRRVVDAVLSACETGAHRWTEPAGGFAREILDDLIEGRVPVVAAGGDELDAPDGSALAPGAACGPYRILRVLGRGGMGIVYLAHDPRLDRLVALKRLPEHLTSDPEARARLVREARAASALDHPNIATIYEVAEDEDGWPYIAMAYYPGETLERRLTRPLARTDAVEIVAAIADGIAAAHARGVVHRDIKPRNVILLPDGGVKILDFGIAEGTERMPGRPRAIGTLAYMSPEQTRGRAVDGRSDIWSIGVVLFEALTGSRPFDGHERAGLVQEIRLGAPRPPEELAPDLAPALIAIVRRCLEKAPDDRYPSAASLAEDLRAAISAKVPPTLRRRAPALPGWVVASVLSLAGGALLLGGGSDAPTAGAVVPDPWPVVVAQVETRSGDSVLALAVTDLLRVSLGQSVAVDVTDGETIARTLARMDRPASSSLDEALAREVARRVGAAAIVSGGLHRMGSAYALEARILEAESGREVAVELETARDSSRLIEAVDRLARRLRAKIGEPAADLRASPPLERVTTPSLVALEKYSQAMHIRRDDVDRAVVLLREAVSLDTSFAMALRWLGTQSRDPGALTRAFALRDRVTPRERYAIEGTYHQFVTKDRERAVAAYRSLLDLDPDDWLGLWNLGVEYTSARDHRRAEDVIMRALQAHPDLSYSFYQAAAVARLALGRPAEARETLEAAAEHFPGMRDWSLFRWASARRDYRAAAERGFGAEGTASSVPAASLDAVFGRVERALARLERAADGAPWSHRDAGRRREEIVIVAPMIEALVRGDAIGARSRLEQLLREHPPRAAVTPPRYGLLLARAFAVAGDPVGARQLVGAYDAHVADGRIDLPGDAELREAVKGHVAFAEGRLADAIESYRRVDVGPCTICILPYLGRALEEAGHRDSAIAVYDRYVETPYWWRLESDRFHLASTLERLARLHAGRGDRGPEIERLIELVDLWTDADPDLQPRVEAARLRLAELEGVPDPAEGDRAIDR